MRFKVKILDAFNQEIQVKQPSITLGRCKMDDLLFKLKVNSLDRYIVLLCNENLDLDLVLRKNWGPNDV